jgi:D-xylose 1-dehydrogenase (NADP+, D-xylono-1,5-lactone-forming)
VLRWGVLSTAHIAQTQFVPAVRSASNAEVVAVSSRDVGRAQTFAASFEIPKAHGSYEALLEDPEVDAVYIGLPNSLHREWTVAAAHAGKHVLCEKPLARSVADAEAMVQACQQSGVLLMEAFMWRHHAQQARVRALLDSGVIGAPRVVSAAFAYRIDTSKANVRLQAELEGGALMDVGCYAVNAARWVFSSEPLAVSGEQILDETLGVDMAFGGTLVFPNGGLAVVETSFVEAPIQRLEIGGSEGRVVVERPFRPDALRGRISIVRGAEVQLEDVAADNQYARQVEHFGRSVAAGRLLEPAEDGVAQARVIEALYAAAAQS